MDSSVEQLIEVVSSGNLGALLRVLKSGVDVNGTCSTGETALLVAAKHSGKRIGTINNLLGAGADVNAVEPVEGRTALHLVAMQGNVVSTKRLLEAGADLGLRDKSGLTALELAGRSGQDEVVKTIGEFAEHHSSDQLIYLSSDARKDAVLAVGISRDGKTAAAGVCGDTNKIVLWDVDTQNLIKSWNAHESCIQAICFSPDGKSLLSGGMDCKVHLWSLPEGRLVRTLDRLGSLGSTTISFSQDGAMALCSKNWSYLWDPAGGDIIHSFPNPGFVPGTTCLSPDGTTLLEGKIIWDCVEFKHIGRLPEAPRAAAYISPGSVITASDPGMVCDEKGVDLKKWQLDGGKLVQEIQGHRGQVDAICVSGDKRFILSAGRDGELRFWNAETSECLASHREDCGSSTVGLSHDGSIAVAGYRTSLLIWRPLAGPLI